MWRLYDFPLSLLLFLLPPRSSSIFGDAKPVTVKEKEIKPKSKPKPRADKEGGGDSQGKEKKPQRSDGVWTKEKVGEGGKKILQRDNTNTKDKKDVSSPHSTTATTANGGQWRPGP